jgi:predicted SprT family Zn-dependent metalloprotease
MAKGGSKGVGRGSSPSSKANLKNAKKATLTISGDSKHRKVIESEVNRIIKENNMKGELKIEIGNYKDISAGEIEIEGRTSAIKSQIKNYEEVFKRKEGENSIDFGERLDKELSKVKIKALDKMKINTRYIENMSEEQVKEIIKHEFKHIQQAQEGRLYIKPSFTKQDMFVYNGKEVISTKVFDKVMSDMSSRNQEKAEKAYIRYRSFGWEVEANEAGDPFK